MVSVSKLINNGLILATQQIYSDLATPEQAAVEQYNLLHFLSNYGPYVQHPGFGISTDIPDQCTLEQVQLVGRHGERFPSKGVGKSYEKLLAKLQSYNQTFKGDLSFLNDYTYFVPETYWYEKESTPANSEGPFSGTSDALKHGAAFRSKYNSLFENGQKLPVFSSNSGRCYQTSDYFARGFLGDNYTESAVDHVIVSESGSQGANSLTPVNACNAYNSTAGEVTKKYNTQFMTDIVSRFEASNPGLNITESDVQTLYQLVGFEINVRGYSPFANLFTNEEYIKFSYLSDLSNYYSVGPGNKFSKPIGSTFLTASLELLKNTTAENKIWLAFSHDTNLEPFAATIGLVEPDSPLDPEQIPFPNGYVHSKVVPMGARIVTEKYACGGESYVRYLLNDAVIPLKNCSSGPGFSCKLSDYEQYVADRLSGVNYVEDCKVFNNVSQSLTFYWDYNTVKYNASLLDG